MRYDYSDIFQVNPDGTVVSDFPVKIHGSDLIIPPGTPFRPGIPVGDYDVAAMVGREIKATIHDVDVFVIERFY
jgi:hypothetical protein